MFASVQILAEFYLVYPSVKAFMVHTVVVLRIILETSMLENPIRARAHTGVREVTRAPVRMVT